MRKFKFYSTLTILTFSIFFFTLISSTHQHVANQNNQQEMYTNEFGGEFGGEFPEVNEILTSSAPKRLVPATSIKSKQKYQNNKNNDAATYIRASIPLRIFQCVRKLSILRCMKLFLLQKMESKPNFANTGNLTRDFLDQFFADDRGYPSLFDKRYKSLNDTELTNRLIWNFQKFFKDRDIQLHFIPGVMVQVIPSKENKIKLSLKKEKNETTDQEEVVTGRRRKDKRRRRKHQTNYKHTMIQMAVPVLMMPAILLGTFLPFMLPAFKMATIMSALLNKGALLAAIMYAARTSALNNDAEIVHYNHPGYH